MLRDLLYVMFPDLCAACGRTLSAGDTVVCTYCRMHLPKTNYHLDAENPVVKHFWGKTKVEAAAAFYFFQKGEKVQNLLHQFKYKGRKEIGNFIGELYGAELKQSPVFSVVQAVIPVPLHESKKQKRGYNQSDHFAEGLAKTMQVGWSDHAMIRREATETQTKKNRYARFENVDRVFHIADENFLRSKHVLLVDDVITTGSTLTACAEVLLEVPGVRVSIAAIACA